MCRKKNKNANAAPTGAEEKRLREQIIARIDDVMFNWSMPLLLITDKNEAAENEQKIKANLQRARDIMDNMSVPRGGTRVIVYANKILDAFENFRPVGSRLQTGSQATIVDASEQIVQCAIAWLNL